MSAEHTHTLPESSPTISDGGSEIKEMIGTAGVDISPAHAAEYQEYLALKETFEADPARYKRLVRKRWSFDLFIFGHLLKIFAS